MKIKTLFISSLPILIASGILLGSGCKKKVQQVEYNDAPATEQKQETTDNSDNTVWEISTPQGNFSGHKLEINNGVLEFVSDDGYKVYVSQPFLFKTKAN